ncbi:MAG: segregation/condensation protein A [Bacteroidetes bacterium]|nr:segregation/condensation protein A [Bacteroidota bacterium]MBU1422326.1 segregation/condensation protein A [Bacteroidota bacterium]MBU2471067.1 segregation/condensation protein A [Bacteroidota bacterium]MBU2636879.1 segregation/condensation protein A [Bacteroidota bacterium]
MAYKVKLQQFEGPLDLLLFFIKRDELDIKDIPISRITKEFLDYLNYLSVLDLEVAGDFIVMAAELMQIKVKMLLPQEPGDEEEQDPRSELVRRLLEYKRFKEITEKFSELEQDQKKLFYRKIFHHDPKRISLEDQEEGLKDITIFKLITAFKRAMDHAPKKIYIDIESINISIDEQMSYIVDFFRVRDQGTFLELVSYMSEKIRIIVTVIAMLELMKAQVIGIKPMDSSEDDFIIYKIKTV